VGPVPAARAHAVLERSSPADGETVAAAPDEVTLEFSEPVDAGLGAVRVYDERGRQVDTGDAGALPGDPAAVRAGLPPDLPDGTYVTTWNVVSADGHRISGALVFGLGEGSGTVDEGAIAAVLDRSTVSEAGFTVAQNTLRVLVYGGALLAVGGVVFLLRAHDRRGDELPVLVRVVRVAAVTGAVASLAGVPVQGALVTGLGARALVDPGVLGEVLWSSHALSALLRAAGLAALAVAVTRPRGAAVALAGAVLTLVSFVVTGHAASAQPGWLYVGTDLVHTAAGATWFGGLVLLVLTLRGRRSTGDAAGAARVVARFSGLATAAVLAVTAAGLVLAVIQVQTPRALVASAYGWVLLAKVAVVAGVAALGAYNSRRLVPAVTGRRRPRRAAAGPGAAARPRTTTVADGGALATAVTAVARTAGAVAAGPGAADATSGPAAGMPGSAAVPAGSGPRTATGRGRPRRSTPDAWRTLQRIVRWEAAGLAVVVAVTGVLTTLVPARTAAGIDGPFSTFVPLGQYELNVTVDPGRAGANEYHFYLMGPDGRLSDDVAALSLGLSYPAAGIGPISRTPDFVTPGHWTMAGDELSIAGTWQLEVSARVGEFDQATATVPVTVNP